MDIVPTKIHLIPRKNSSKPAIRSVVSTKRVSYGGLRIRLGMIRAKLGVIRTRESAIRSVMIAKGKRFRTIRGGFVVIRGSEPAIRGVVNENKISTPSKTIFINPLRCYKLMIRDRQ